MKIHGLVIPTEDVIVIEFVLVKAKLMTIGIAGANAIRKTFSKYYDKPVVDKIMLYNRHNRKVSTDILSKYKEVYTKELKALSA